MSFLNLAEGSKLIIGMVHMAPMPGTPFYEPDSFDATLAASIQDGVALFEGGATGCLIQTVDRVYTTKDDSDPARVAAVAVIAHEIRKATGPDFKIGVQLMRNALSASLAICKVADADFVRAGTMVGATLGAHGLVEADPLSVMNYRRQLDAMDIAMIAEVDSMHFKWLDGTKSTAEVARMASYVGADAASLGDPDEATTLRMIAEVREKVPKMPIVLAGYTNHDNAARLLREADGAFVGTCLEKGGWGGAIDVARVKEYMDIVQSI